MPEYTFSTLSPHDFEILSRDLLQKEWQKNLESFKSGRDRGIDLRYSKPRGNLKWIVQCKHYRRSGYSSLKDTLRATELPKIKKLNPTRYVVVTSVELSPDQKDELVAILAPYCDTPADIIGSEDLNNLLGKHPEIERQHFKLWLPSSEVLHRLLLNGVFTQSALEVDEIQRHLSLFVPTDAVDRGLQMLDDHGFCMLTGIPGIGKTTTARILVAHHVYHDWQGVYLASRTTEAFDAFRPDEKQIFFYDDFLGQTSLQEKLFKNEDKQLCQLINACRKTPNTKRLVLTTREHLFEQAKQQHEVLSREGLEFAECTVSLRDYTKRIRAEILVNHLFFFGVASEVCSEFVTSGAARETLEHEHYNPRIVESMCKLQQNAAVAPAEFGVKFIELLDNPEEIWQHAYQNQLTEDARQLLLVFALLGNNTMIDALRTEYRQLAENTGAGLIGFESRFRRHLDELEGCFLTVHPHPSIPYISYHNPSIKDFTDRALSEEDYLLRVAVNQFTYDTSVSRAARLISERRNADLSGIDLSQVVTRIDYLTPVRVNSNTSGVFRVAPRGRLRSLCDWLYIVTETADDESIGRVIRLAEQELRNAKPHSNSADVLVRLLRECERAASACSTSTTLTIVDVAEQIVDVVSTPDEFTELNGALSNDEAGVDVRARLIEAFPAQIGDWLQSEVEVANSSEQINDAIHAAIEAGESLGLSESDLDLENAYERAETMSAQEDAEADSREDDWKMERHAERENEREIDDILNSLRE